MLSLTDANSLTTTHDYDSQRIFGFDACIQNVDRTLQPGGKTNLFLLDNKLTILDHEKAFTFIDVLAIFSTTQPWELDDSLKALLRDHVLWPFLKRNSLHNLTVLEGLIDDWTAAFWDATEHIIGTAFFH